MERYELRLPGTDTIQIFNQISVNFGMNMKWSIMFLR